MFKRIRPLLLVALAALSFSANALQETPITLTNRTTGTVTSSLMYARDNGTGPRDVGVIATSQVTSVTGSATLTITLQGKTPQGEYYDLIALTPVQMVAATVNTVTLRPGITAAAGASSSQALPPVFRVKASLTGTGSATYSIGISRTQ